MFDERRGWGFEEQVPEDSFIQWEKPELVCRLQEN